MLHPITNADGARLAVEMQELIPTSCCTPGTWARWGSTLRQARTRDDPIYPESKVRPRLWETWLPDIYINMHG